MFFARISILGRCLRLKVEFVEEEIYELNVAQTDQSDSFQVLHLTPIHLYCTSTGIQFR